MPQIALRKRASATSESIAVLSSATGDFVTGAADGASKAAGVGAGVGAWLGREPLHARATIVAEITTRRFIP
jgi:hypothetical protein